VSSQIGCGLYLHPFVLYNIFMAKNQQRILGREREREREREQGSKNRKLVI
jgi:hypothetical protein